MYQFRAHPKPSFFKIAKTVYWWCSNGTKQLYHRETNLTNGHYRCRWTLTKYSDNINETQQRRAIRREYTCNTCRPLNTRTTQQNSIAMAWEVRAAATGGYTAHKGKNEEVFIIDNVYYDMGGVQATAMGTTLYGRRLQLHIWSGWVTRVGS